MLELLEAKKRAGHNSWSTEAPLADLRPRKVGKTSQARFG